ncbi:2-aminoethylphosphonate ABC transporter permease subunit [Streptomyces sp. NPDC020800]|uniref:2-aminoethylphosphonate ABC transporter permease subunit n=1 Tax=Streptomyces sp. NPDC020800 TaxID=3365092 RepID=UPI0037B064CD
MTATVRLPSPRATSGHGAARARRRWRAGWVLPPLLVLAALVFYPLVFLVRQSLSDKDTGAWRGVSAYTQVFDTVFFQQALFATIKVAVLSTIGCLVVGFVLAFIVAFVPFPGSRMVSRFIDVYVSFPSFLIALSFTFLYGQAGVFNAVAERLLGVSAPPLTFLYSIWGVVLAEVTFYTPFVMRPLLGAFSLLDPATVEVASSLGARPWRVIRRIVLPEAMPAVLAGGSLCLLLTLNEYGIVAFIGVKSVITLPLYIYSKAINEFDYTSACVAAVVDIVLSLALYALYRLLLNRTGGDR